MDVVYQPFLVTDVSATWAINRMQMGIVLVSEHPLLIFKILTFFRFTFFSFQKYQTFYLSFTYVFIFYYNNTALVKENARTTLLFTLEELIVFMRVICFLKKS